MILMAFAGEFFTPDATVLTEEHKYLDSFSLLPPMNGA